MHRPLFHLTRLGIGVIGAAGIVAAVLHQPPSDAEVIAADPIVPASVAATPDREPTTSTTTSTTEAPTTTTTVAPATTTTPPPPPPPTTATPPPPTPAPTTTAPPPTTAPPAPAPAPAPTTQNTSSCESELFQRMNQARANAGIAPVSYDGAILSVARNWSARMADRQDLQHNPDFANQVFAAQPRAMRAAENVGRTTHSVASMHQAFMDSSSHRANILNGGYSHAAAGCVVDGSGQLWATVNFWGG